MFLGQVQTDAHRAGEPDSAMAHRHTKYLGLAAKTAGTNVPTAPAQSAVAVIDKGYGMLDIDIDHEARNNLLIPHLIYHNHVEYASRPGHLVEGWELECRLYVPNILFYPNFAIFACRGAIWVGEEVLKGVDGMS